MSLKKDIIGAEVQIGSNEAQKSLVDLSQKTAELANKNDLLRKSMAGLKALGKENEDEYKALSKELRENTKTINANNSQMDALRKTLGLSDMTMKQLRAQASSLRRELNNMNQNADPQRWEHLNNQLIATERQMSIVRSGIGQTSSFLGQLGSHFTSIPGPVGSASQSIIGLGKTLWTLVANPVGAFIAAIVASLMLLYKAFTSTDDGAVKMEGTLKAIGNVMDILIDRAMSYYKMLWSLVTFDWEGVEKNAKDAFGGIVSAVKDATSAGWDYAQSMDDIEDREAAAANRMTKLRVEIEKLKNASKDQSKSTYERMQAAQLAMDKEIELNNIETGFLKEKNDAETKNLASKIQNSKLSMAQKEEQLKQWLAVDDLELASMMEKDAAFADFVNKNADEFQSLQKSKSDELMKEAELAQETRRLQSSLSQFKKELSDEEKKRQEENQKRILELNDETYNKLIAKITDQYINEGKSEDWFHEQLMAAEMAYLVQKKALLESFGQSTVDVDRQINQKRIEAQKELNAALDELGKAAKKQSEDNDKAETDLIEQQIKDGIKATEANIKLKEDEADREKQILKQRQETYLQFAQMVGQSFGDLIADSEATFADYMRNVLLMSLEALHQFLIISRAKALIQAAVEGAPINPIAVLKAVAKVAAMEMAYQAVKGLLTKKGKQSGGYADQDPRDDTPAGIYHANEFIASAPAVRNPTVKPVLDIIDMAQKSGTIRSLNLNAILNTGKQSGGYASLQNVTQNSGPENYSIVSPAGVIDNKTAKKLIKAIERFNKKELVVYTKLLKNDLDTLEDIEKNRKL